MIVMFAEKPDMGRIIAAALGGDAVRRRNGYLEVEYAGEQHIITWGFGHLYGLKDAKDYDPAYSSWNLSYFPFFPKKYEIKPRAEVNAQIKTVNELFQKADLIINAADADREGELIFAYTYQASGARKPVKRLWLQSTTPDAVCEAYSEMRDGIELRSLEHAARARSAIDWCVGINMTIFATKRFPGRADRQVISIGRVQTPTLAMLVERELAIRNFVSKPFYNVVAEFTAQAGTYSGTYEKEKLASREDAEAIIAALEGKSGKVVSIEQKKEKRQPPYLYDLSTLQMDANSKLGLTAQQTLDIAQKLYEKQLLTYPRTTSRFLPEDMKEKVKGILHSLEKQPEYSAYLTGIKYAAFTKRHFDSKKVESHYAIIPTVKKPSGLNANEQGVYDLVAKSLIRIAYPAAEVMKTKVITEVEGYKFKTSGDAITKEGWLSVDAMPKKTDVIPPLTTGDEVSCQFSVREGKTEPPKRFTDKTLIGAMESAGKEIEDEEARMLMKGSGIGTPATRASIIETLMRRGFARRERKSIVPTEAGIRLITWLPIETLKSPAMTGEMEKRLYGIEHNTEDPVAVLRAVEGSVLDWCSQLKKMPAPSRQSADTGEQSSSV